MPITKKEIKHLVRKGSILQVTEKILSLVGPIIDVLFEEIKEQLKKNKEVNIKDFGKFEIKERKETRRRNPVTREIIIIPKKKVVTFRPSKNFLIEDKDEN